MKQLILYAMFMSLTGCAAMLKTDPAVEAKIQKSHDTMPVCSSEKDCNALMDIAQGWVAKNSRTKIDTATRAIIETSNEGNVLALTMRVTKEPVTLEKFKIAIKTNALVADDAAIRQEFNDYLNSFLTKPDK